MYLRRNSMWGCVCDKRQTPQNDSGGPEKRLYGDCRTHRTQLVLARCKRPQNRWWSEIWRTENLITVSVNRYQINLSLNPLWCAAALEPRKPPCSRRRHRLDVRGERSNYETVKSTAMCAPFNIYRLLDACQYLFVPCPRPCIFMTWIMPWMLMRWQAESRGSPSALLEKSIISHSLLSVGQHPTALRARSQPRSAPAPPYRSPDDHGHWLAPSLP